MQQTTKRRKRFWLTLGGLFLVPLITIGAYYTFSLRAKAQSCFTMTQIQSDSRCLYIYKTSVYEKGTRSSPHQGNPCGSDVTAFIPESHLLDKVGHLDPNYQGDLCAAAPPTATPTVTPAATATPSPIPPTAAPVQPTATPTTSAPVSTATPTPRVAMGATNTPTKAAGITTPTVPFTPTPTGKLVSTVTPTISILPVAGDVNHTSNFVPISAILFFVGALGLLIL